MIEVETLTVVEKVPDHLEDLRQALEAYVEYDRCGWPDCDYVYNLRTSKYEVFTRYVQCRSNGFQEEATGLLVQYLGKRQERQ